MIPPDPLRQLAFRVGISGCASSMLRFEWRSNLGLEPLSRARIGAKRAPILPRGEKQSVLQFDPQLSIDSFELQHSMEPISIPSCQGCKLKIVSDVPITRE